MLVRGPPHALLFLSLLLFLEVIRVHSNNYACTNATEVSVPYTNSERLVIDGPQTVFTSDTCTIPSSSHTLWFSFTATSSAIVRVSVEDIGRLSLVGLAVFSAGNGAGDCSALTCVARNRRTRSDYSEEFMAPTGTTYYVVLVTTDPGDFVSTLRIETLSVPNDTCEQAINATSLPFSATGSNVAAFPSFQDVGCRVAENSRGIWYRYAPPSAAILAASIRDQSFVARLSIFRSDGGCGEEEDALVCVGSSDASRFRDITLQFSSTSDRVYYFHVSGLDANSAGQFRLILNALDRPSNDRCTEAVPLNIPDVVMATNTPATPFFSDSTCSVAQNTRALWYTFTPSEAFQATARITGHEFGAVMAIFRGSSCNAEDLVCITSETSRQILTQGVPFSLSWSASAGTTYYILITGDEFVEDGFFRLELQTDGAPQSAPFPTPVPTTTGGIGGGGGIALCFPGTATVQHKHKGVVFVKDIKIGDPILVADNIYEEVYSFGHKQEDEVAVYLRFETTAGGFLEMSPEHMVFAPGQAAPKPASLFRVGDELVSAAAAGGVETIQSIIVVRRPGIFAPFTPSGTIVVNGFIASAFVAFQESADLRIGNVSTGISHQWLSRRFELPHRVWCDSLSYVTSCDQETYHRNGISEWHYWPHKIALVFVNLPWWLMVILGTPILLFYGAMGLVLDWNFVVAAAMLWAFSTIRINRKARTGVKD